MKQTRKAKAGPLPPIRVRNEPPTIEEALFAAEGLTDDEAQQLEIAATLMAVSPEEVAPLLHRRRRRRQEIVTPSGGQRGQRAFVVERKPVRRRIV